MRWDVINALLARSAARDEQRARRYLEIGVQRGACALRVAAAHKVGVDPAPMPGAARRFTELHVCTSDAFFAALAPDARFDVIFVDGLHHADQVMRDVEHALAHLAPGGTVVLHDCNPQSELAQRVPRATGVWNGDAWKALVALRQRADLDVFVIDADHGLGIVRPGAPGVQRCALDVRWPLCYQDLVDNREELLGLTAPECWQARLDGPPTPAIAPAPSGVTVVSAIFGGRDVARPLPPGIHGVLFTDGAGAPGWEIEHRIPPDNPRRAARRIKALALDLVAGDHILWVDGRITVRAIPPVSETEIAALPHPWRTTVAAEAHECSRLGLADPLALAAQLRYYDAIGFPDTCGLWNTMCLWRTRSKATEEFGRSWWAHLDCHTLRDQISFPVVLWEHRLRCSALGPDLYPTSSAYFALGEHVGGRRRRRNRRRE